MGRLPRFVVLEKPVGQTPLACIEAWRANHSQFAALPASYAGRLDPMASGKLLVLLGDECKNQSSYTKLDKEYDIEIILDIGTDTGDALGLATENDQASDPTSATIETALRSVRGTHTVPYPAFSSKTVDGIPLFLHTLRGSLDPARIPHHEETVYRATCIRVTTISKHDLQTHVETLLAKTPRTDEASKKEGADFRIAAIQAQWRELFKTSTRESYSLLRLRVSCASGTYMRTLATRIASALGTTAFALSIHRTRIGRYRKLTASIGFWMNEC